MKKIQPTRKNFNLNQLIHKIPKHVKLTDNTAIPINFYFNFTNYNKINFSVHGKFIITICQPKFA